MGKRLEKFEQAFDSLPWVVKAIMSLQALSLFHTFAFHGGQKADMWHMERHTHDNNGVAVVPSIWDNFRDNR